MSDSAEDNSKSICGAIKAKGGVCRSRVKPGTGPCVWHAKTFWQKLRSWARNQTLSFVLTISFGIVGVVGVGGWAYDEFLKAPPVISILRIRDVEKQPVEQLKTTDKVEVSKKAPLVKTAKEIEPPAFAVAIEVKLFVPGPISNEEGTGFWGVSNVGANCFLQSADTVMLIRIKNLQPIKTMITAYNLDGIGGEYSRIKMISSRPVLMLPRSGDRPVGFVGPASIAIPAGSGNANGGFVHFKFADTDYSHATPMIRDILDAELADHYLEPGETVRGWAFFEYPSAAPIPAFLKLTISDDLGHIYSYKIPDEAGNPRGDALRREITFAGPALNLSSCTRLPHPSKN